jgi:hypothetical protein
MSLCALDMPSTVHVVDRRYVVDVEMGTVNIFVDFPGLDRASPTPAPDSHLSRVGKGRLRYIHTMSTCEHPGLEICLVEEKARQMKDHESSVAEELETSWYC